MTPPATAPTGPATTRPVPAPAAAPTQSARALGAAIVTAPSTLAANTLLAKMQLRICLPLRQGRLAGALNRATRPAATDDPINSWQTSGSFAAAGATVHASPRSRDDRS